MKEAARRSESFPKEWTENIEETAPGGNLWMMPWTAQKLAAHFDVPLKPILSLLGRLGTEVDKDDPLMLSAEDEFTAMWVIARAGARCVSCKAEYEAGTTKCACGVALGRCSHCWRYASFKLAKRCRIERDEWKCEACGGDCAACNYGKSAHCFVWAPRTAKGWLARCFACEIDPERLQHERERKERTHQAVMMGVAHAQARRDAQDAFNREVFFDMFGRKP